MGERAAFRERFQQPQLLHDQKNGEHQSPDNEVPGCPVPEAGQHPHHQNIQQLAGPSDAVAAQRDIHIIPEPGAQRYVPASPELCDAGGNIGIVKVFKEVEAKYFA